MAPRAVPSQAACSQRSIFFLNTGIFNYINLGNQTLHILGLKDEVSFGEEERKYSKGNN